MADDIDAMLQDEEEKTRSASPAGNNTHGSESRNPIEGDGQQTPEEIEWNSLKGSTQERIRQLILDKKKVMQDLEQRKSYVPQRTDGYVQQENPEVKEAVGKLSAVGIATDEKVEKKIDERVGQLQYQYYLDRLETKYSGDDGKPRFDRMEYEDYVSRHPEYRGYLPEDVYQKMYHEELLDWEMQHVGNRQQRTTKILRSNRTNVSEEQLSPELIEQRLKEPDGPAWYEKNKEKIDVVLAKTSQE